MKYKVTLNGKTYEIEVEAGKAMCLAEYEAIAPSAAPVAAPVAAPAPKAAPAASAPVAAPVAAPAPAAAPAPKAAPAAAPAAGGAAEAAFLLPAYRGRLWRSARPDVPACGPEKSRRRAVRPADILRKTNF